MSVKDVLDWVNHPNFGKHYSMGWSHSLNKERKQAEQQRSSSATCKFSASSYTSPSLHAFPSTVDFTLELKPKPASPSLGCSCLVFHPGNEKGKWYISQWLLMMSLTSSSTWASTCVGSLPKYSSVTGIRRQKWEILDDLFSDLSSFSYSKPNV